MVQGESRGEDWEKKDRVVAGEEWEPRTLEVKFWKRQLRTLGVESEAPGAEREIRTLISWVSHPGVVAARAKRRRGWV